MQQNRPPPPLPTAPGPVIELPAPKQQVSTSALAFPVKRIVIDGNTLVTAQDLLPLIRPLEGKTDRLAELQGAAADITALYHVRGYPLAYAYLPAQKITDGVVHIAIVEPKYDRIDLHTQGRYSAAQGRRTLGLKSGEPVEQAALQRGLLLLDQTPGIRVAGTLVPGAQPATSSLNVAVQNTPLVLFSAGADNYGNRSTGRGRGLAQVSVNDPFGYGGQIAANALRTEGGLLQSEGLSLLSPNIWKGLRVGAYGSHTHYTLGGAFAALEESGRANQYGVYASVPLILAPERILQARLDVLQDRFGESSAVVGGSDDSHLDLMRLTLAGSWAGQGNGVTTGGVIVSRGDNYIDSADARAADALGPHASGHFWVAQAQLARTQNLPRGFRLRAAVSGQWSSKNLDGSQKFYLGGPRGVMSYAVGEGGGDEGVLARLGLFHPIFPSIPGLLTAGALLQGGTVWVDHSVYAGAASNDRTNLAGAGFELDYQFDTRINVQLDYAHRVGGTKPSGGSDRNSEFWLSAQVHF